MWITDPTRRWLDIEGAAPDELHKLLAPLNLHPLILENCLEPGSGSRAALYEEALFLEFPTCSDSDDAGLTYLSIICLPTTLLTIHKEPIPAIQKLADDLTRYARLLSHSISALLYSILDRLFDQAARLGMKGRDQAAKLSHALDEASGGVELKDILDLKHFVGQLTVTLEDQAYCLTSLRSMESPALKLSDMREYFNNLIASLEKGHHASLRLENRLRDLHQHYLLTLQDITSSRLKILTILSAVYLPSTLMAGIYGMNFNYIPILSWRYGYFVVLCSMIGIVVGQLLFFHYRGWFK